MKYLSLIVLLLATACTQRDKKMCDCLEVSEKLNTKTAEALKADSPSEELIVTIKNLRDEKEGKCIDFQMMSGEEMLKKAATCK